MKTVIVGKDLKEIEKLVQGLSFKTVKDNPDLVISYGGDGTLIHSERHYPGIPKLAMRNSKVCKKCPKHEDKKVLQDFLAGKLKLKEHKKLHTNIYGKDLYALNEFVIRNKLPIQAIRFRLKLPRHSGLNPKSINKLLIGDGIVVATPFGSTGYFQSITGETFTDSFALAFNNTTEKKKPICIDNNESIEFELVRGKAILAYDNSPDMYHLSAGTKLKFELSDQVAQIYGYETMRCPNCQVIRG